MTASNALLGLSILVLEDDFYLAQEIADVLEGAGAVVLGPYGDEREALRIIQLSAPDCAVLDMNLGYGPTFETARILKGLSIPFILATGYDASAIPADLLDSPRLTKPVAASSLLAEVMAVSGAIGNPTWADRFPEAECGCASYKAGSSDRRDDAILCVHFGSRMVPH